MITLFFDFLTSQFLLKSQIALHKVLGVWDIGETGRTAVEVRGEHPEVFAYFSFLLHIVFLNLARGCSGWKYQESRTLRILSLLPFKTQNSSSTLVWSTLPIILYEFKNSLAVDFMS